MNRIFLLSIVYMLSVWMPVVAQSTVFDRVDSLVASYADQGLFSGTVLVARTGEVFSHGYGLANRSWDIANTTETRFQIGSLTKPFTATLILQLEEEGVLSLDDPLAKHLPDYPADYGADVTLRQMLSHRSGIPSYTNFSGWVDTTSRIDVRPTEFMKVIAGKSSAFEPGTDFSYSNSNYYLLGLVAEKVTGMSYGRALQGYVLKPAQVKGTGYKFSRMIVDQMAEGYERLSSSQYEEPPFHAPATSYAAGGIYSVVGDLYRWEQLFYTNRLLTEETRAEMMTPRAGNYGYGWIVGSAYPDEATRFFKSAFTFSSTIRPNQEPYRLVWHWGSNPGFNSLLVRVPELRWTIILLENQQLIGDPEQTDIYDIAGKIVEFLDDEREW